MPPPKKAKKKQVADYRHEDATRPNNPPAALARDDTAKTPKVKYEFDPHKDPQLVWSGKAEQEEIEVDAPSLHIHERISAEAILRHAQREDAELTLFADPEMERSKAIEFYEHEMGWANRLILGDSLIAMNSLLERERMAGQVQMIYIDPPYGIKFNSNFQSRISSREVVDGADKSLTREPEMIQAYRDTWELGPHSYLSYLRGRIRLSRELLTESGSIFIQIGEENVHRVRLLLDEEFGEENFCSQISYVTTSSAGSPGELRLPPAVTNYLIWFAKSKQVVKYRPIYLSKDAGKAVAQTYSSVELPDGTRRSLSVKERNGEEKLPEGSRLFTSGPLVSKSGGDTTSFSVEFEGEEFLPQKGYWKTNAEGMQRLIEAGRVIRSGNTLRYVRYKDDFDGMLLGNQWSDTGGGASNKRYVVQTNPKVVQRAILMTTEPGDLVLDPTCGSGTTAASCEELGRRWVSIDTSRVALSIARENILTRRFPFYELQDDEKGVDGGFIYKRSSRVTLRSIARGSEPEEVAFVDQPKVRGSSVRVSGPFTVESLSRYGENPAESELTVPTELITGDESSEGEDAGDHRDLLLEALRHHGIPIQGKKPLKVETLEPIAGSGSIHAEGKVKSGKSEKTFAVSLGPRYGPITQIQVDEALDEAKGYDLVVFVGFTATAEVQEYLAPGKRGKVEVALVEANADLLLGDLLKNTSGSQTFRLFSSPDAEVKVAKDGEFTVELHGMDSYDAASGEVTSRSRDEIAAWFLDHDYDGTVFHVNQAFFTGADAWDALKKALKAEIDPEALEALNGFESLPFKPGESGRAAIRVIDDAGQTSEMVLELKGQ
jgi:adenine-specific DNA-methyltransferase